MCLILFSIAHHPRFPLIIAANRDESFKRPAAPLAFWDDAPEIAGGRDLSAGGTWFGITRGGRWAALTNFRQAGSYRLDTPSRGQLVGDFLRSTVVPKAYVQDVEAKAAQYNGFSLLVGIGTEAYFVSNRTAGYEQVSAGAHGLSNHLLDTPWPKVTSGRNLLNTLPDVEPAVLTTILLRYLQNREIPRDADLPDTGVGIPGERILSPTFIAAESYGTRASTVLLVDRDGNVSMTEHSYGPLGKPLGVATLDFQLRTSPAILARVA